jgi:hypothetical protein
MYHIGTWKACRAINYIQKAKLVVEGFIVLTTCTALDVSVFVYHKTVDGLGMTCKHVVVSHGAAHRIGKGFC